MIHPHLLLVVQLMPMAMPSLEATEELGEVG